MMFDRFVNFYKLNNLIWVYNTIEFKENFDPRETYFPGHDVVDILAADVYAKGFDQENYDQLLKLAGDKPIALGEVGKMPAVEKLKEQPRWIWFMSWGEFSEFGNESGMVRKVYESKNVITLDELPWTDVKNPKLHYPFIK